MMKYLFFGVVGLSLAGLIIMTGCSQKESLSDEQIIARVGDRTITVDEFIRRAEYTIRPPYCSEAYYVHKKIVLNSLFAKVTRDMSFPQPCISKDI